MAMVMGDMGVRRMDETGLARCMAGRARVVVMGWGGRAKNSMIEEQGVYVGGSRSGRISRSCVELDNENPGTCVCVQTNLGCKEIAIGKGHTTFRLHETRGELGSRTRAANCML